MTLSTDRVPSPSAILHQVSRHYGLTFDELVGPRRYRHFVGPRHLAMALLRHYCHLSYEVIGDIFGHDHTSVSAACKKFTAEELELWAADCLDLGR